MTRIPLQNKDDFEHSKVTTGVDVCGDSSVNHALKDVAQEVAQLLKQTYSVQADSIEHNGTIDTRTIKAKPASTSPEYRQIITNESLTERESVGAAWQISKQRYWKQKIILRRCANTIRI